MMSYWGSPHLIGSGHASMKCWCHTEGPHTVGPAGNRASQRLDFQCNEAYLEGHSLTKLLIG